MNHKIQMRLNVILALVFAVVLMTVETIRRYEIWGHWSAWMDDYLMGMFLILAAISVLKKKRKGHLLLAAAWAFNAGLLYGSFFSKVNDPTRDFQSNINSELLILLTGLGFFVSLFAMVWTLLITMETKLRK